MDCQCQWPRVRCEQCDRVVPRSPQRPLTLADLPAIAEAVAERLHARPVEVAENNAVWERRGRPRRRPRRGGGAEGNAQVPRVPRQSVAR